MSGAGLMLTNNEGRLDQLILGNDILKQRIDHVRAVRAELISQGKLQPKDANPSLGDIEQTHLIYVHAQFKSYVSINYEYYKVNAFGGSPQLKTDSTVPLDFQIPQYGDFIADTLAHVVLNFPTYTDTNSDWLIKAADYPGVRLFQNVALSINSNTLDEYDAETANFTRQFMVLEHKKAAFDRCVGQEEHIHVPQNSKAKFAMSGSQGPRMWGDFTNGAQTPKAGSDQAKIEMFVPFLLFHQDVRLALPAVCLPSSHRYFKTVLSSTKQLFGFAPRDTSSTVHPAPSMQGAVIDTIELYVNNIFIHDEVHDIFVDRIGFNLIRVHKAQDFNLTAPSGQEQLSQFKFPTETIFIGVRPNANLNTSSAFGAGAVEDPFLTQWHKYSGITTSAVNIQDSVPGNIPAFSFDVPSYTKTVKSLTIISQSVDIYKDFPSGFYDSYIPFNYGGVNIGSSRVGDGTMMITFNFYPGTYQPSGYINISRSAQFYFKYSSDYISTSQPCTAVCRSLAINFLVINNGNAYLRYLT
jgi:hypothetical protein